MTGGILSTSDLFPVNKSMINLLSIPIDFHPSSNHNPLNGSLNNVGNNDIYGRFGY